MQTGDASSAEDENDELRRFREAWKDEVRRKRAQDNSDHAPAQDAAPPSDTFVRDWAAQEQRQGGTAEPRNVATSSRAPRRPAGSRKYSVIPAVELNDNLKRALEAYEQAIRAEESGDLDLAVQLYRRAFRLDDHVHHAYRHIEARAQSLLDVTHGPDAVALEEAQNALVVVESSGPAHKLERTVTVSGPISGIISEFPPDLGFEPEDGEDVPIDSLPDEILVHILMSLDPSAIERFAAVNRKARILSLDSAIWRRFVRETYKPPQISDDETVEDVANQYHLDYRRLYVEHPRLRLDGVYISVCHYIRQGVSQDAWVNVSHLITYHRYLRFFPDGSVLSLLANDALEPQTVIPQFKHTMRMKGLSLGTWSLTGTTIIIEGLAPLEREVDAYKYIFRMTLALRSRPLGRWNKLEWVSYESVRINDGEAVPLPLKHERPFWFSKVRSFAV